MIDAKLRAWWSHRQGLDGSLAGQTAAAALERAGWSRSLGGASPYLGLFARAGLRREAVDRAVRDLEIHELPSARGCTYVVPASDFALALKMNLASGEGEMNVARKLGVTDAEISKLCSAVVKALAKGPLTPDELRDSVGGAVRNLGDEGKKKGLTTTLPVALGKLQAEGEIRRVPMNERLDQQRYRYTLWRPNPLNKSKLAVEEASTELARRFFAWLGPATVAEFQGFAGLGVKTAKAAVEPLKLEAFDAAGRFMLPADREKFEAFRVPKDADYKLIGSIDSILELHHEVTPLFTPEDAARKLTCEKGLKTASELDYLPNHAIVDRGRVVGLWDYDPESQSIAWTAFIPKNAALKKAVEAMEKYVREDLGDARSFSLDSVKSRAPRLKALRAAG